MENVRSFDGTRIAFDRSGHGSPIVLVVGAFNLRSTGEPLAESLATAHSMFTYDRRGRGDSTDTPPYSVAREIDDLAAVIDAAGGSAAVFGYSSGGMLALEGAAAGLPITRLALYEAPYLPSGHEANHAARLAEILAEGRRGDAVEYFQSQIVGIPEPIIAQMRHAPFRPALEAMAHTLVYEATIIGDRSLPTDMAARVTVPTLVVAGSASPAVMSTGAQALADLLPHGRALVLDGQTHDIDPAALGPALSDFFL
jgi:pimeloyl-ACP methyl ester carboxylesterase